MLTVIQLGTARSIPRVSPQNLGATLLEQFHSNDKNLATQYARDISLLQRNGVEIKMPDFQVVGENVSLEKAARIKIKNQYVLPLKVSSILRTKLGISQREYDAANKRPNPKRSRTGLEKMQTVIIIRNYY